MKTPDFERAMRNIIECAEGDVALCDYHMASGNIWRKAMGSRAIDGDSHDLLVLDIGDSPPIYVAIENIESIQVSRG